MHPAQRIGINVHDFTFNERITVVQALRTRSEHSALVFIFDSRWALFLGSLGIVNSVKLIIQFGRVDGATTIEAVFLRKIEVFQSLAGFLLVPADFLLLVQDSRFNRLAILVFLNQVSVNTSLAEHTTSDWVDNPVYELAVLVVCNLSLVHKIWTHLHRARLGRRTVCDILGSGTHTEIALIDEDHSFKVDVFKNGAILNANQFALVRRTAAPH